MLSTQKYKFTCSYGVIYIKIWNLSLVKYGFIKKFFVTTSHINKIHQQFNYDGVK